MDHFKRVDRGIIILFNKDKSGEVAEVIISRSRKPDDVYPSESYSRLIVEKVIKNKKALTISDVYNDNEAGLSDTLKLLNIGSVICVPLISGSNVKGVIYLDSFEKPYGFRKEDLSLLIDLSNLASIAIDTTLFNKNF